LALDPNASPGKLFRFLMVNYPDIFDMMIPGAVSAKNGVLDRPPSVATVQTLSLYTRVCAVVRIALKVHGCFSVLLQNYHKA
jgi:hypothetical protein